MLKITSEQTSDFARLTLEGSLSGPWVTELERVWQQVKQAGTFAPVVELTDITFIAEEGRALLTSMWREGAVLVANGCCTRHIVAEITGAGGGQAAPSARCEKI
ncbi:MAG: hypothetical protein JNM35_14870 [Nitrospira sp.]|nr:hypothetical protein [Nitrospira sp.]MCS6265193.1 hypothetical protein [Nitrospira sp.]